MLNYQGGNCEATGMRHQWVEKTEWYSKYLTQAVGKYWLCTRCKVRSEEKPT